MQESDDKYVDNRMSEDQYQPPISSNNLEIYGNLGCISEYNTQNNLDFNLDAHYQADPNNQQIYQQNINYFDQQNQFPNKYEQINHQQLSMTQIELIFDQINYEQQMNNQQYLEEYNPFQQQKYKGSEQLPSSNKIDLIPDQIGNGKQNPTQEQLEEIKRIYPFQPCQEQTSSQEVNYYSYDNRIEPQSELPQISSISIQQSLVLKKDTKQCKKDNTKNVLRNFGSYLMKEISHSDENRKQEDKNRNMNEWIFNTITRYTEKHISEIEDTDKFKDDFYNACKKIQFSNIEVTRNLWVVSKNSQKDLIHQKNCFREISFQFFSKKSLDYIYRSKLSRKNHRETHLKYLKVFLNGVINPLQFKRIKEPKQTQKNDEFINKNYTM